MTIGESDSLANPATLARIQHRYAEERDKRLQHRPEGTKQYTNILDSSKFKQFSEDPWLKTDPPPSEPELHDGLETKFLMIGAGFGALLFAIRLLQAGFDANDMRFVDYAGGFGGTWYWNRYPGLMCDIESYMYLPLLEETGYIPKHKYSYGTEIREYTNLIAEKWNLKDKAWFQTRLMAITWDDTGKEWIVVLRRKEKDITIRAQFVISTTGILNFPQLPGIPGIESFQGSIFHTSRWNYDITGGSPSDPALTKLKGKRVGIIGTGATGIQIIPEVAKWAKELYVFQRTPSAIDERGQRPTDENEFRTTIATGKGWQHERSLNFTAFLMNISPLPPVNMVNDGWTYMPSMTGLMGSPAVKEIIKTANDIPKYIAYLHALDMPRQERIRQRVDKVVEDKQTAERLKAWYYGWCKRPCFHDEYLPTFNLPHVHLIDTNGTGVSSITKEGPVVDGVEYPLDLLILSTGFHMPFAGNPAVGASSTFVGRDDQTLDKKWENDGIGTLHGVITRGFPNLFFPGPVQIGLVANRTFVLDSLAKHVAYIISEASKRSKSGRVTVEPTEEGQRMWTSRIVKGAPAFASLASCTPGYYNREGNVLLAEEQVKAAQGSRYADGFISFLNTLEVWRSDGEMSGLEVVPVS